MSILRSFDDAPELGIVDLAHRLGLSPSTTHRIVRALVEARLLDQDPRTERYRLGVGLAELGLRTLQRLGVEAARPLLEELAAETGESVNLGVRHGGEVLVVLRVASAHPLRVEQPAGSRVPVHTSAMGKAILAWAHDPAQEVDGLDELGRATTRTLTSRAALKRELQRVREIGYAVNDEERNIGVRAVGRAGARPARARLRSHLGARSDGANHRQPGAATGRAGPGRWPPRRVRPRLRPTLIVCAVTGRSTERAWPLLGCEICPHNVKHDSLGRLCGARSGEWRGWR